MKSRRESFTADELVEMDKCPCDMCSSQDDEDKLLERQKLDEICDIYSNYMIDYILENRKKDILKQPNKQDKLE